MTYTEQPLSKGDGSPASCAFFFFLLQWVIVYQLLPADLSVGTMAVVQVAITVMLGTALC